MVEHPLSAVEGRGRSGPVLVVGAEPNGPLTVGLSGQESGQPCGPNVGMFPGAVPREGPPGWDGGEKNGLPSS